MKKLILKQTARHTNWAACRLTKQATPKKTL